MHPNWNQIKQYLDLGMSLIPVRDREEKTASGIIRPKKTPSITGWKKHQVTPMTEPELFAAMDENDTQSIALICGKVSGNIEVIDIDVKYYPGIDAILFLDIQKFYPNIWDKLLIHQTPSGGYHLIYRVSGGEVPGNKKLAGRLEPPTPTTKKQKQVNFIETRGEGGYIVVPPSEGYSHHLGTLNILTFAERTAIIAICQSYTQIIKVVAPPKQPKEQGRTDYYGTNPFDDFNASGDAADLLTQFGWQYFNDNSHSTYWTRPDRQEGGISASFSKTLRTYYIFTTSTELDSEQGMSPSTLLGQMKFGGDYKALYAYLQGKGYGKINPSVENRIIDRRASDNRPVPANLSEVAKTQLAAARTEYKEKYPFGIFWDISEEDGVTIDRMKLYRVCEGLRFYQYASEPVVIIANLIYKQTIRQFYDALHGYVREEIVDKNDLIRNAIDVFFEKHGKHALFMLAPLDTSLILASRKKISYKFYRNGVLTINKDGYSLTGYTNEYLVWAHMILQRDFTPVPLTGYNNYGVTGKGIYYDFLNKAIGLDTPAGLNAYPLRCIGYLTHDYKDSEGGYLIVLTEMCKDPKQGGGAGKNIFSQLLSLTTSWHFIDGSTTKTDATLLQAWHFERIISITDVPRSFPYNQVKSKSDGQIQVKRLFKDIFNVPLHDNPKILISTNFSPDLSDGGLIRRVRIIEFTDFFTKSGGVNTHYGKMFPDGWDLAEYNYYDNLGAYSIQLYLQDPLLLAPTLSIGGWQKQFEQEYGSTIFSFIDESINDWIGQTYSTEAFTNIYEKWCIGNNVSIKYRLSMIKINRALEAYCSQHSIAFNKDARIGQLGARGRQFGSTQVIPVTPQVIDEELLF